LTHHRQVKAEGNCRQRRPARSGKASAGLYFFAYLLFGWFYHTKHGILRLLGGLAALHPVANCHLQMGSNLFIRIFVAPLRVYWFLTIRFSI
jgi:hypothetical protein